MVDAVIQPLEVFILDSDFKRLTGSIPYQSLTWTRRYYKVGEFQMQVPSSMYSPDWAYVYCEDRPETGIVQKAEYDDTTEGPANGEDTVTVSGFFLEEVLNRLVFLVEEAETQEIKHVVPKPTRLSVSKPQFKQDADGNIYTIWNNGTINNCMTGEAARVEDSQELIAGLTDADVQPGKGIYEQAFNAGQGDYTVGLYSSNYSYVSEDGKLHVLDARDETQASFDIVGDPSSGLILYKDADGSTKWVNGAVESYEDTYRRKTQRWESLAVDEDGKHYYMEYRTVKGPWMLRTDIDDVTTAQDNVEWVIKMAQRAFQGNFIYDEPGFEGEVKTLSPSLSRIGDFFYKELQSVEAGLRVLYDFPTDQMVFQVWRGLDRTQGGGGQTPVTTPAPDGTSSPWAVFSDTWGTLYGYSASHDTSNYRNKCYVMYDYYEPVWDSGNNRIQVDTDGDGVYDGWFWSKYDFEHRRGFWVVRLEDDRPDAEVWLDLREEEPDFMDGVDTSGGYSEHQQVLGFTKDDLDQWVEAQKERGRQLLLTEYGDVDNLDTGTVGTMRYLYDFDLGDKVDTAVYAVGLAKTARITEVEEVYESGSADIRLTMGEELLTTTKRADLV